MGGGWAELLSLSNEILAASQRLLAEREGRSYSPAKKMRLGWRGGVLNKREEGGSSQSSEFHTRWGQSGTKLPGAPEPGGRGDRGAWRWGDLWMGGHLA